MEWRKAVPEHRFTAALSRTAIVKNGWGVVKQIGDVADRQYEPDLLTTNNMPPHLFAE
jgi:hypothetical protein